MGDAEQTIDATPERDSAELEAIDKFIEHARQAIKLDLAYLVAGGAIATALRVSLGTLLLFAGPILRLYLGYVVLVTYDIMFYGALLNQGNALRLGKRGTLAMPRAEKLFRFQLVIHAAFVVGTLGYGVASLEGGSMVDAQFSAGAVLQREINTYAIRTGSVPKSLDAIQPDDADRMVLDNLTGFSIHYVASVPSSYTVTLTTLLPGYRDLVITEKSTNWEEILRRVRKDRDKPLLEK